MTAPPDRSVHRWLRFREDLGILLWASFLSACIATMVFFAFFDPLFLSDDTAPPTWLKDRLTAYTAGFFFFWVICAMASFVTAWLIDTRDETGAGQA